MKKIIPVLLVLCLLCGLAACGSKVEDTNPAPVEPVVAEETAATPEPAPEEAPAEEPAEQEEAAAQKTPEPAVPEENDQLSRPDSGKTDNDSGNNGGNGGGNSGGGNSGGGASQYELAQQYLGSDAATFRAAVGAPSGGVEYTISCEQDGAQDGVWYYDGFVAWSIRYADGTEIVRECDAY